MPCITLKNVKNFYDEIGSGPAILTTNVVTEKLSHWGLTGVSGKIRRGYYE